MRGSLFPAEPPHARSEHLGGQMMIEEVEHMPVPAHAHAKLRADAVERALDDFGDPKRIDASLDSAVQDAADALTIFRVNADVRLSCERSPAG